MKVLIKIIKGVHKGEYYLSPGNGVTKVKRKAYVYDLDRRSLHSLAVESLRTRNTRLVYVWEKP